MPWHGTVPRCSHADASVGPGWVMGRECASSPTISTHTRNFGAISPVRSTGSGRPVPFYLIGR